MSREPRPELSRKNKYWIEPHRYYELKHFCLQYDIWKKLYHSVDAYSKYSYIDVVTTYSGHGDPVVKCAEAREDFLKWMKLVEQAALDADGDLATYILQGVTQGLSFDQINAREIVPCSRDTYYDRYRRFFWLLSRSRK